MNLFPLLEDRFLQRRSFLAAGTTLAAAVLANVRLVSGAGGKYSLPRNPFTLGVASGDPSADGFVLWTRLAPDPIHGGGMPLEPVEVTWEVADDERFEKIVRRGTASALPEWAHSVHVELKDLAPDRWYWYRFRAGDAESPVGRTRTFPAADAAPSRLRFAFASCQHYEHGYFTAYEYMLRDELDCVVHLGDYIYEGATAEKSIRKHNSREIETLDEYRNRYALYRGDTALAAAHARYPWLVTWDDHEFDNNCANDISEEVKLKITSADFLKRRARAYQAYYEHMPLRRSSLPQGPDMTIYREVPFGRLASFFVLDTRQYRTDQPCGDGNKPPCKEVYSEQATLLGDRQEKWLTDGLVKSPAAWNILAQQVMMARVDRSITEELAFSMDQWPGYEMNRRRLLRLFEERKIANPVVLAGDIHTNWANDLVIDWEGSGPRTVGSELVGTSITSGGDGPAAPKYLDRLLAENPFVRFHNTERGYVRCQVTPSVLTADFRTLPFVTKVDSPLFNRATFAIENGRPGPQRA